MTSVDVAARVDSRDVEAEFCVANGETVALTGPNGAGKSTLLGMIAGTVAVSSGSISVGGVDVTGLPPHRRRVTLLAQDPLLFPHLTALDNVAFGPRARGSARSEARATALGWLEAVGLADLAHRKPRELSGGQAQRVAVARALAIRPDVVLLDEPLRALDVDVAPAVRALLGNVLADVTTILVSHDPEDVRVLADRTLQIADGRVSRRSHSSDGPAAGNPIR
jgi:molybdate transport system ATP-binding protein